ncbi:membrane protein [Kitasatospora sp. NE20-6]|uniref:glycosyltransferase family 39 protein n=1 Tax=Kitasatospora sp. NE20-6 TaxID=2859066 RepID=UPI0034DBFDEB
MTSSTTSSATTGAAAGPVDRPGRLSLGDRVLREAWIWPVLLTVALGLYHLGRSALWRDELATWSAAHRSIPDLVDLLRHVDAVTGPYYLLMHGWTTIAGTSEVALRLPSVFAMAAAAGFVGLTARKLFGRSAGLVAGCVFALTPSVSRYAQEARGYAFAVLAVAAATFFLFRALERPGPRRWLPYGLAVAAAASFHLISLSILAGHACVVAMRWHRTRERRTAVGFALACAAGLLPAVPLALAGSRQVGRQLDWLTSPSVQYVVDWFWRGLFGSAWYSMCVLVMAVLPMAWHRGRRPAIELGLVAILPIPLVWLVSQGGTAYFLDRYLLFTVPGWAVLAAAGLTRLRPRPLIALALAFLMLICVPDQRAVRKPFIRESFDIRAAAAVIAHGYRPGDGMVTLRGVYASSMLDISLGYYLPADVRPKDVLVAEDMITRGDLYPKLCADFVACLGDTPRVWAVTIGKAPLGFYPKDQTAALTSVFPKQTSTSVRDMTVTLMERG